MKFYLGEATKKQWEFCKSEARYSAFGGARGGGKSHALRLKAILGCVGKPGLRVLIVRRTYPELESSIAEPMMRMLGGE
jgi:phage terminase large subunit